MKSPGQISPWPYHFISYRRKSVDNLVEIQNTFVPLYLPYLETFYSSSDWSRARLFAKGIDYATVRSSFVTLLLTNNYVRRLPCPFDGDCSAGSPYRCVWRARSRRPHTHATCERRVDAKASSEDALVDVEVDRCIDDNSASNHG